MNIARIPKSILFFIVWAYLITAPIYAQGFPKEVAARMGIIWVALTLAILYEHRTSDKSELKCWGNICRWKMFRDDENNDNS